MRLVVKPARTVTVRVNDAAGAPVPGAAVEAFDYGYQFHATTAPDGVAALRVPADARIRGVIGLKSGAGFDYFENYRTTPPNPRVRIPTVARRDHPHSGRSRQRKNQGGRPGRSANAGCRDCPVEALEAREDRNPRYQSRHDDTRHDGRAGRRRVRLASEEGANDNPLSGVRFFITSSGGFYPPREALRYVSGGPTELTVRLGRIGAAHRYSPLSRRPARPADPGHRELDFAAAGFPPEHEPTTRGDMPLTILSPGLPRMIAVKDETWAAPSLTSDVLKEGQEQGGLDFTLSKGTLVHGRVTEGPEHRPSPGASVALVEEGGPLPKELRTVSASTYQHCLEVTHTDAQGRYQFRVGPGRYVLRASGLEAPNR